MNKLYKHLPNHLKKRTIKKAHKKSLVLTRLRVHHKYAHLNTTHDGYDFDGYLDFQRTVENVAKEYSREAAIALRNVPRLRRLPRFTYNADVSACFLWVHTPQGQAFWEKVNKANGGW